MSDITDIAGGLLVFGASAIVLDKVIKNTNCKLKEKKKESKPIKW